MDPLPGPVGSSKDGQKPFPLLSSTSKDRVQVSTRAHRTFHSGHRYHVYPTCRNTSGILGFSVTVGTQATKYK